MTCETQTAAQSAAFLDERRKAFARCELQGCTAKDGAAASKASAPACAKVKKAKCDTKATADRLRTKLATDALAKFGAKASTLQSQINSYARTITMLGKRMKKNRGNAQKMMETQTSLTKQEKLKATAEVDLTMAREYVDAANVYKAGLDKVRNMFATDAGLCCTGASAFTNPAAFNKARADYESTAAILKAKFAVPNP